MDRSIEVMETTIPKGRTLRIEGGKGFEVSVLEGSLWVTQEHEDKTLGVHETCLLDRDGTTLAHAVTEVRVHIAGPVWAGTPRVTLGGGYREFGMSVARPMFVEWRNEFLSRVGAWLAIAVQALRAPRMRAYWD